MPCCEISDCAEMSKTIIAVRHFGLGGRESLETAVTFELGNEVKFKNLFINPTVDCFVLKICRTIYLTMIDPQINPLAGSILQVFSLLF